MQIKLSTERRVIFFFSLSGTSEYIVQFKHRCKNIATMMNHSHGQRLASKPATVLSTKQRKTRNQLVTPYNNSDSENLARLTQEK